MSRRPMTRLTSAASSSSVGRVALLSCRVEVCLRLMIVGCERMWGCLVVEHGSAVPFVTPVMPAARPLPPKADAKSISASNPASGKNIPANDTTRIRDNRSAHRTQPGIIGRQQIPPQDWPASITIVLGLELLPVLLFTDYSRAALRAC